LFNSPIRELKEMAYQYDRDYLFNSSKFEKHFNYKPIPIEDGIKALIKS
jgi:nucleoside-diphosphate-sugar epimerase